MTEKIVKFACPYCNQDFDTLTTLEEFDNLSALYAHLETAKRKYYVDTLELSERGLPQKEELKRLGLDFVIPVLEPMDALS